MGHGGTARLRVLQACALLSSALLGGVSIAALRAGRRRTRLVEISVERLNIVEPDGTVRVVISNEARAPDGVVDGKRLKRQGGNAAGLTFYNNEGDECGGLIFGGRTADGRYGAGAGLLFDQFKQDQTIGIQYQDANGERFAGLRVWDRPAVPLSQLADRYEALQRMPDGPEKTATREEMRAAGLLGTTRLFVGRAAEGASTLNLHDADGNVRLRLLVDASGTPRLELLDEHGEITHRIPPETVEAS